MTLLFYITGHGFGHATRTLAVIEQILRVRPEVRIVIRSDVPKWFLHRSGPAAIEIQPMQADTGMVQVDSLTIDEAATADRAAAFYRTFGDRVAQEAAILANLRPSAVIGDIPPLAFAAARVVAIPSVAIGNFTWDWIYEAYPGFARHAPGVIDVMRAAYAQATCALRLPFAGGFETMTAVTRDIALIARRSRLGRARVRDLLDLPSDRPVVLASFGGHRTAVPYDTIARRCRLTLVLTDHELAPTSHEPSPDNLRRFDGQILADRGIRYEDLVAASDIVVSKPGYGIVSECIANQSALLYTSRGHFAENDVLVEAMAKVIRCRFVDQERLRAGEWQDAIEALLEQPAPVSGMRYDGAEVAAAEILGLAGS